MIFTNTTTNHTALASGRNTPESYTIILAILGSLGFLFNGVLLFVLWRNKTREFRSGTSYVIGNLALADSLTGLAVIFYATHYDPILDFQLPMVWTTIEASLMSLTFLSVERTIAFYYPFESKSIVTVKRTVMAIIIIWILAITCGIFVHFYTLQTQFAMTIIFELCVLVFLVSQGYIIARMQKRKRGNLFCDKDISMKTRKYLHGQRINNHVTKVVLILIVIVVVTLLPYMLAMQIYFLPSLKLRAPLDAKTTLMLDRFIMYFYPVELLNFIVNPIIYAYRLKRYRNAFFYAFSFLQCGPFVKERARTFSGSSQGYNQEFQKTQRMSMIKNDVNLNNVEVEHC